MRIYLYTAASSLKRYRNGEEVTARLCSKKNASHGDTGKSTHTGVHEEEVSEFYPSGFVTLRGKRK